MDHVLSTQINLLKSIINSILTRIIHQTVTIQLPIKICFMAHQFQGHYQGQAFNPHVANT